MTLKKNDKFHKEPKRFIMPMTKMDMIWTATANLIHPKVTLTYLVSEQDIKDEVWRIWKTEITDVMLNRHLVSSENRMADRKNPKRGGVRKRYLFRTENGTKPDRKGNFRLFKKQDAEYDGLDKDGGPECPEIENVDSNYRYLVEWYKNNY